MFWNLKKNSVINRTHLRNKFNYRACLRNIYLLETTDKAFMDLKWQFFFLKHKLQHWNKYIYKIKHYNEYLIPVFLINIGW